MPPLFYRKCKKVSLDSGIIPEFMMEIKSGAPMDAPLYHRKGGNA